MNEGERCHRFISLSVDKIQKFNNQEKRRGREGRKEGIKKDRLRSRLLVQGGGGKEIKIPPQRRAIIGTFQFTLFPRRSPPLVPSSRAFFLPQPRKRWQKKGTFERNASNARHYGSCDCLKRNRRLDPRRIIVLLYANGASILKRSRYNGRANYGN